MYFGQFSGGLNSRDSVYEVEKTQARDLLNVTGTANGAIRKRTGLVAMTAGLTQVLSLATAATNSSPYSWVVGQAYTQFFSCDPYGTVTLCVPTPAISANPFELVAAPYLTNPNVYAMNGFDSPRTFVAGSVGSGLWGTTAGTQPNGKYLKWHGNRMFVAGMSAYAGAGTIDPASTVIASAVNDPTNWDYTAPVVTGAWSGQFDPFDGEQITGLGVVGPYLLVFKPSKSWVVYNLDTGANRRLSQTTGCISHRSIAETPEGTMFLSSEGQLFLTDGKKLHLMSDIVRPTLKTITNPPSAAGIFFNNHYYLSYSTNGLTAANNLTLDYDFALKSWWLHSFGMTQMTVFVPRSAGVGPQSVPMLWGGDSVVVGGGYRVAQLFAPNTYGDYGNPFLAQYTHPWQSPAYYRRRIFNTPDYRKRVRAIRADINGHVQLNIASDYGGFQALKDTNVAVPTNIRFPGPAAVKRTYSLKWSSNNATDPFEIENYVWLLNDRHD